MRQIHVASPREWFKNMLTLEDCKSLDIDPDEYLTLKEASALTVCDIEPVALRAAIHRGKLTGKKFGNTWGVKCKNLFDYLNNNNRKFGRPRKSS